MPDAVIVLADGTVRGEHAGHGRIDHGHLQPLVPVSVVLVDTALCHGIGAEILEHKVTVGHGTIVAQEQRMVQGLEHRGTVGQEGAVDHLRHGLADLLVGFIDLHGVVVVLAIHILHGVCTHAEDVDVIHAHLLADLHVGAIHGANGQRAVHHELHVAGAAGLLGGGGQLLGNFCRRNQHFRGGDIVVLQEHHLQHFGRPGMLGNQVAEGIDEADNQLGPVISRRGLGAEEEYPRFHGIVGIVTRDLV